jgi:hypothetical protein
VAGGFWHEQVNTNAIKTMKCHRVFWKRAFTFTNNIFSPLFDAVLSIIRHALLRLFINLIHKPFVYLAHVFPETMFQFVQLRFLSLGINFKIKQIAGAFSLSAGYTINLSLITCFINLKWLFKEYISQ